MACLSMCVALTTRHPVIASASALCTKEQRIPVGIRFFEALIATVPWVLEISLLVQGGATEV